MLVPSRAEPPYPFLPARFGRARTALGAERCLGSPPTRPQPLGARPAASGRPRPTRGSPWPRASVAACCHHAVGRWRRPGGPMAARTCPPGSLPPISGGRAGAGPRRRRQTAEGATCGPLGVETSQGGTRGGGGPGPRAGTRRYQRPWRARHWVLRAAVVSWGPIGVVGVPGAAGPRPWGILVLGGILEQTH